MTSKGTVTQAADEGRTGWFPDQPALDPDTVKDPASFGLLFNRALPNKNPAGKPDEVYAQPLVNNGRVFIATSGNWLYSLDAATGVIMQSRSLGTPYLPTGPASGLDGSCGDQDFIGVTGTPVIDASTNTAYFFSKVADANNVATWNFRAVNVATLADVIPPVVIGGTAQNDPAVTFYPQVEHQRPAVVMVNGVIYGAFGGHCDKQGPGGLPKYRGWLIGLTKTGQITTLYATEDHTGDSAGIWQSGGGVAADETGKMYYITGNGAAPTNPTPGNQPPTRQGEALMQVQVQPDKSIKALSWFAPYNSLGDSDFSAGSPVLLPAPYFGTASHPNLIIAAGKLQTMYVMDRDALGGYEQSPTISTTYCGSPPCTPRHTDLVLSSTALEGNGSWSKPAVWPGDGGWVYQVASGAPLMAMKNGQDASGNPTLTIVGHSPETCGFGSGAAIVTSSGATSGSGVVWINQTGGGGQTGFLTAYNAVPVNGTLQRLFQANIGPQVKFSSPGVGAGRVYAGGAGIVAGFGSAASGPVGAATTNFGTVVVGSSAQATVTITANESLSVTDITSPDTAFTRGNPTPALNTTLTAGQTMTIPVTFKPTAVQLYSVRLNISTTSGPGTALMRGTGQFNGPQLSIDPTSTTFGVIQTGTSKKISVTLKSTGSQPVTFNGFTQPASPFSITGLPGVGSTLASGSSVAVDANYSPTVNATNQTGTFTVLSNGGNPTLALAGSSGAAPKMLITPLANNYGDIPLGTTETQTFTIKNTGGSDLIITKSKPPGGGTFAPDATGLPEGTTLAAGTTKVLPVIMTPIAAGTYSDYWVLNSNDGTVVDPSVPAGEPVKVSFSGSVNQSTTLARTGWTASSNQAQAGSGADLAIDAATNTRFTTGKNQASGYYFQVNLGSPQTFTQLTLNAGNAGDFPGAYQVFASNDPNAFGSAIATGAGSGQLTIVSVPQITAQYVRVTLTAAKGNWWSIADFTLSSTNAQQVTPLARTCEEPCTSWVASSSIVGSSPSLAIDGYGSTRWTTGTNQSSGMYYQVDMGAQQTFGYVTLDSGSASPKDYLRGFAVYVSTTGADGSWGSPVASGTATGQITSVSFPNQTARFLRVQATAGFNSWWSVAEFNVYSVSGSQPPPSPPLAPSGLTATAGATGTIDLTWSASPSSGVTYSVYRGNAAGFTPSTTTRIAANLTALTYSNGGLPNSTKFYYVVQAVSVNGSSPSSNEQSATTVAAPAAPAAPSALAQTAATSTSVSLSWTASATSGVTYTLYRSTTSGFTPSGATQVTAGITTLTFTDSPLVASTTYYYVVQAANGNGSSSSSNQATAATAAGSSASVFIDCGQLTSSVTPYTTDAYYAGGGIITHNNNITFPASSTGYAPAAVYWTGRTGAYTYTIPGFTLGSTHTVRLHFADTYFNTVGSRIFNVNINSGAATLPNFDIVQFSGGKNAAYVREFSLPAISVAGGAGYVVSTVSVKDNALISGIEIN